MKKVACLIYPYFSLYEVTALTSTLVLSFGVDIDYIATSKASLFQRTGSLVRLQKLLSRFPLMIILASSYQEWLTLSWPYVIRSCSHF